MTGIDNVPVDGTMILVCGLLLLLPLPVVLLSAAMLERDGYFIVAGSVFLVVAVCFFGVILLGGAAGVNWVREWSVGLFAPPDAPAP